MEGVCRTCQSLIRLIVCSVIEITNHPLAHLTSIFYQHITVVYYIRYPHKIDTQWELNLYIVEYRVMSPNLLAERTKQAGLDRDTTFCS